MSKIQERPSETLSIQEEAGMSLDELRAEIDRGVASVKEYGGFSTKEVFEELRRRRAVEQQPHSSLR